MAIKLVDELKAMGNFPIAHAEGINLVKTDGTEDNLQNLFDNGELGGGGDNSTTLTQEEYEALPEEEKLDGLYYTYDTKRIYKNGVQYGASEPIPLTMEEYKALKEAGAIDEKQEYLVEADAEGILLGAEDIGYNNAESGIQATTVQGAIDKVVEKVDNKTEIDDTSSSTTNTYSSAKIDIELAKKLSKNYNLSLTDANTVIDSGNGLYMYRVESGCLNIPVNRIGIIISNNYSDTQYKRITQTYMTNDDNAVNGLIYMRYGMSNNSGNTYTWSGWKQISYLDDTSTNTDSTWSSSKIASIMPTTRSLTLKTGYAGYITETYDPTTKVVVYNVNVSGTFKGLGNSIATGFKVPKDATSSSDVMHTTLGLYGTTNVSTGDAQFTRLLVRSYSNPFLDVDIQGEYIINGTITYVTA